MQSEEETYSAIQPVRETSLPRPGAWNTVIIWRSRVPASLTMFLHYVLLLLLLPPPPCWGIWFEGILGGEAGLLAVWV